MNVAAIRKRLHCTQTRLAELLGVHPMTVSKWERGALKPTPHQRRVLGSLDVAGRRGVSVGGRRGEIGDPEASFSDLLGLLNTAAVDVSEIGNMQLSASNQLRGKVIAIEEGPVSTRVVMEIAPRINIVSVITTASVRRLRLVKGRKVVAIIKATEVIIGTP